MTTSPRKSALYLTRVQLDAELHRCLNCRNSPCMTACPVNCNPQEFIQAALAGRWSDAVKAITRTNPMGQTCGLICPDKFCMQACTRHHVDFAINIPRVQATILDRYREADPCASPVPSSRRIAIIGGGPAGIAAASRLSRHGIRVTLYEARSFLGGALTMIPQERLPRDVIQKDWAFIPHRDLIDLKLQSPVEDPVALCSVYDGVIVATGEPHDIALGIPGESLSISYREYLQEPEKYRTSGAVAVIGGGNVAADCALTARRMGASDVEMFIRRRISDMRTSRPEFLALLHEDISLCGMSSPEAISAHGELLGLHVRRNQYVDGRWVPLPNSVIEIPYFSRIIRAIGSRADAKADPVPDNLIYAGDCKTGGSTIVEAIASGLAAADHFLDILS